jgi:hypothetical protein
LNAHGRYDSSLQAAREAHRVSDGAGIRDHPIPASPAHHLEVEHERVVPPLGMYAIRIRGRLGATAISAFPSMLSELDGGDTVLTGVLEDRSALFGVIAQIEALGLELLELRHIVAAPVGRENP